MQIKESETAREKERLKESYNGRMYKIEISLASHKEEEEFDKTMMQYVR